jgi:hypothetical protein
MWAGYPPFSFDALFCLQFFSSDAGVTKTERRRDTFHWDVDSCVLLWVLYSPLKLIDSSSSTIFTKVCNSIGFSVFLRLDRLLGPFSKFVEFVLRYSLCASFIAFRCFIISLSPKHVKRDFRTFPRLAKPPKSQPWDWDSVQQQLAEQQIFLLSWRWIQVKGTRDACKCGQIRSNPLFFSPAGSMSPHNLQSKPIHGGEWVSRNYSNEI